LTRAEYAREYRQARRETARLVISGKRAIRKEYIKVFSRIARVVRENKHKPFLEEQIRGAFPRRELYECLKQFIMEGRGKAVKLMTDINKRYILEALEKVPGCGLSAEKISRLFDRIAEKRKQGAEPAVSPPTVPLLRANTKPARPCTRRHTHPVTKNARSKTYQEYTFHQYYSLSKSVWNVVTYTEDKIMDVVWGGISQGRDVRSVAADLMAYLKGGPDIVKGRWGKLKPGEKVLKGGHWQYATKEARQYAKRLGSKGVDYRVMRLYRSEIHRNQQEAAVEEGEDNPACTGKYDWILVPGRGTFLCDCPELAKGGPYTKATIPPYPHPNCLLKGIKVLTANGVKNIEKIQIGDMVISADGSLQYVKAAWKTKYSGDIYHIKTKKNHIKATANHPFYSSGRTIPAKLLKKGHNLTGITTNRIFHIPCKSESENSPAAAFQKCGLFVIIDFFLPGGVPVTAIYFNGKFYFRKGKIDIVDSTSVVGYRTEADVLKLIKEREFIAGTENPLFRFGSFSKVVNRALFTSNGFMRRVCVWYISAYMGAMLALRKIRNMIPLLNQIAFNAKAANAKFFGCAIDRVVFIAKQLPQNNGGNTNLAAHDEEIISLKKKHCNCTVYNITVENTRNYIANGFAVHNCDCMITPRLKDSGEFLRQLRDYVKGAPSEGAFEINLWAQEHGLRETGGVPDETPYDLEYDIQHEMRSLLNLGAATGRERVSFMKDNGMIITSRNGKKEGYSMPKTLINRLEKEEPENSIIVLHNHPSGGSFSADDLFDLLRIKSIKEIRVIGHNGRTYRMTVGEGIRPFGGEKEKLAFLDIYNEILGNKFEKHRLSGLGIDDMIYNITNDTNYDVSDKFGWNYKEGWLNGGR
jgi:hypothetical protein